MSKYERRLESEVEDRIDVLALADLDLELSDYETGSVDDPDIEGLTRFASAPLLPRSEPVQTSVLRRKSYAESSTPRMPLNVKENGRTPLSLGRRRTNAPIRDSGSLVLAGWRE